MKNLNWNDLTFSETGKQFSPWGTIKYAWGLIPEGVHGDHCQLPDYRPN